MCQDPAWHLPSARHGFPAEAGARGQFDGAWPDGLVALHELGGGRNCVADQERDDEYRGDKLHETLPLWFGPAFMHRSAQ